MIDILANETLPEQENLMEVDYDNNQTASSLSQSQMVGESITSTNSCSPATE